MIGLLEMPAAKTSVSCSARSAVYPPARCAAGGPRVGLDDHRQTIAGVGRSMEESTHRKAVTSNDSDLFRGGGLVLHSQIMVTLASCDPIVTV
jgi:hypothetical protein